MNNSKIVNNISILNIAPFKTACAVTITSTGENTKRLIFTRDYAKKFIMTNLTMFVNWFDQHGINWHTRDIEELAIEMAADAWNKDWFIKTVITYNGEFLTRNFDVLAETFQPA